MSYGIQQYGISSWGGSDFIIIDHIPADASVGVSRTPVIGCAISSQGGNVVLASINLSANGISIINNGIFTGAATGTINSTDPTLVQITAQILHAFAPLQLITITVSALNIVNQSPSQGNTWQFTVDNTVHNFQTHIVRKFERVS